MIDPATKTDIDSGLPRARVSVVIPHYNTGPLLIETIASIQSQTAWESVLEILVVDDNSSNAADREIVTGLARSPRVRAMQNVHTKGPAGARNTGIASAAGEWIAFLDSDDAWPHDALATRLEVIARSPEVQWLGTDFCFWYDQDGQMTRGGGFFKERASRYPELFAQPGLVRLVKPYRQMLARNLALPTAVMVRRQLLLDVDMFDEELVGAEDYDLWIRLARVSDYYYLDQITGLYRKHAASLTKNNPPRGNLVRAFEKRLSEEVSSPMRQLIRSRLSVFELQNARYWRKRGNFVKSAQSSLQALKYNPRSWSAARELAAALLRRHPRRIVPSDKLEGV